MTAVQPFTIKVDDDVLEDLRQRIRRTRWPDGETVGDWSQGVPLAYLRELASYWADGYDWRARELRLNRHAQFTTAIDGLSIHFVHQPSPHRDALPLLLTHGWPGSMVEFVDVIDALTDPVRYGGTPDDAFHVVCPALPGFGFSARPNEPGWGVQRIADTWDALMVRLGYDRYVAQGGDWGALVSTHIGLRSPSCVGIHLNMPLGTPTDQARTHPDERDAQAFAALDRYRREGSGYALQQSSRPQTIGYALADSPVGQLAWITEKFWEWTDRDGPEPPVSRDVVLDNVTLYWVTNTATSSARLYWESLADFRVGDRVEVPTGIAAFPKEIIPRPRSWAERHYRITWWSNMAHGGHFAALEQPEAFVADLRGFFATVR